MEIRDYVLIPAFRSKYYVLAQITGEYVYDETKNGELCHYRNIRIIRDKIERTMFPQNIQYSLGVLEQFIRQRMKRKYWELQMHWRHNEDKKYRK